MDWAAEVAGRARGVVRWPGDGARAGRRAARATEPAGRCPPRSRPPGAQPELGNFPGENGPRPLRRGRAGGLPVVRGPAPAVVPLRARGLLHHVRDRRASPSASSIVAGDTVVVEVEVTNTGDAGRRGGAVLRRSPCAGSWLTAQGAQGVRQGVLDPGETTTVELELGERAFAYWRPARPTRPRGRPGRGCADERAGLRGRRAGGSTRAATTCTSAPARPPSPTSCRSRSLLTDTAAFGARGPTNRGRKTAGTRAGRLLPTS